MPLGLFKIWNNKSCFFVCFFGYDNKDAWLMAKKKVEVNLTKIWELKNVPNLNHHSTVDFNGPQSRWIENIGSVLVLGLP